VVRAKINKSSKMPGKDSSNLGEKFPDVNSSRDVLTTYTAKLFDMQHQIAAQKDNPKQLEAMEPQIFSTIRESIAAIFSINLAFTYEELEETIKKQELSGDLESIAQKIVSELNSLEYSSEKPYGKLIGIVDHLIKLYYAYFDGRIPKAKKQKQRRNFIVAIMLFLWKVFKGITFIIWFPFYFFFTSLHRYREKKHLREDPAYKITRLLAKGEKQIKSKKILSGIATYEKIVAEYEGAANDLKALVRSRIIEFYSEIMREHAKLADEK